MLSPFDIIVARWDPGDNQAVRGRTRARFEIGVDPDAYDLFFNGEDGYRAQYYRSVEGGVHANADLLSTLCEPLCGQASRFGLDAHQPVAELRRSLQSAGAKVWISEAELEIREPNWQPADVDEIRDEVLVSRWMQGIRTYAQRLTKSGGETNNAILAGTRAFQGSRLCVFGGFIVPEKPELGAVVPPDKVRRPCQIHDYGFS